MGVRLWCPECQTTFQIKARRKRTSATCPNCGAKVAVTNSTLRTVALAAFAVVFIGVVAGSIWVLAWPTETVTSNDDPSNPSPVDEPNPSDPSIEVQEATFPWMDADPNSRSNLAEPAGTRFSPSHLKQTLPGADNPTESTDPVVASSMKQIPAVRKAIGYFRVKDYQKALESLEEAAKNHPELPPSRIVLAELFLQEGMTALARQQLEYVARQKPNYAGTYVFFGNLALQNREWTLAKLHFELASQLLPQISNQLLKTRFQQRIFHGLSTVAEIRGDWPQAESLLNDWVLKEPKSAAVRMRLARAYFSQGRQKDALRVLQKAKEELLSMQMPELVMAFLCVQQGQNEQGEKWIAKAIEQEPYDADVQEQAARWYLNQHRFDLAEKHAKEALSLSLGNRSRQMLCGVVAFCREDYHEAAKQVKPLYDTSLHDVAVNNLYALTLLEQSDSGQQQNAIEIAESNQEAHPNDSSALATLGWLYYKSGNREKAKESLDRALKSGQISSDAAFYLAHLKADEQQFEEAAQLLAEALQTPGDFLYRQSAVRWYQQLRQKSSD